MRPRAVIVRVRARSARVCKRLEGGGGGAFSGLNHLGRARALRSASGVLYARTAAGVQLQISHPGRSSSMSVSRGRASARLTYNFRRLKAPALTTRGGFAGRAAIFQADRRVAGSRNHEPLRRRYRRRSASTNKLSRTDDALRLHEDRRTRPVRAINHVYVRDHPASIGRIFPFARSHAVSNPKSIAIAIIVSVARYAPLGPTTLSADAYKYFTRGGINYPRGSPPDEESGIPHVYLFRD